MRRARLVVTLVFLAACGATLVAAVRMARTPAWAVRGPVHCASGRGAEPESPAHRAGRELEELVVSEWHRLRPTADEWTLSIPLGSVQAWLECRLPEWAAHAETPPMDVPQGLRLAEQRLEDGTSRLVVGIPAEGWFLSGSVSLCQRGDSWGPVVHDAWVGEQSIPASWLGALGWDPTGLRAPTDIALGDGRHVSLEGISLVEGQVRLRLTTRLGDP